ncbi:hypothetical protein FRB95_013352 [Tulasnella sp. JGI-2019a]|nr:hypothetical protein FRB95_013352 [Tulasnella sp. JGI-2019a]
MTASTNTEASIQAAAARAQKEAEAACKKEENQQDITLSMQNAWQSSRKCSIPKMKQLSSTAPAVVIAKPQGLFSIHDEMGLEDNKPDFEKICAIVITILNQSQVDCTLYWTQQTLNIHSKILQIAHVWEPFLACFVSNWATMALAQQYLKNHIGHEKCKLQSDSSYNIKWNHRIATHLQCNENQPPIPSKSSTGNGHLNGDTEADDGWGLSGNDNGSGLLSD